MGCLNVVFVAAFMVTLAMIMHQIAGQQVDTIVRRKRAAPLLAAGAVGAKGAILQGLVGPMLSKALNSSLNKLDIADLVTKVLKHTMAERDRIDKEIADYLSGWGKKSDKDVSDVKSTMVELMNKIVSTNRRFMDNSAEIKIIPEKGMDLGNLFTPPGYSIKTEYRSHSPEPEGQRLGAYSYDQGIGNVILNGCYGPALSVDDPCYAAKSLLPKCKEMLDAARFIGDGFDGRGEYSSASGRKSIIQRVCLRGGSYDRYSVPDSMSVNGVYDTDVTTMAFSSVHQFQSYLEKKAAVSQSSYMFIDTVNKAYGRSSGSFFGLAGGGGGSGSHSATSSSGSSSSSSSSHSRSQHDRKNQYYMSMLHVDIIRYELLLNEVKFNDLNLDFIQDFVSLPSSYFSAAAPIKFQNFIMRWGTHYIKSAKFGGQLRLYKTKKASREESLEEFATRAQSDYQAMFSVYSARTSIKTSSSIFHKSRSESHTSTSIGVGSAASTDDQSQSRQRSGSEYQYSSEILEVEGGDQSIAAIVSEMYTTGFKHELVEWLHSIPMYPKPFHFTMAPITELCDINFKPLFPDASMDFGCFGQESLLTEEKTNRKYYVFKTTEGEGNTTRIQVERRYCDYVNQEGVEEAMRMRCNALRRAISVYMEEGPIPSTDINVPAGYAGCETSTMAMADVNTSNITLVSWDDMVSGDPFKVIFDMEQSIEAVADASETLLMHFSRGRHMWYVHSGELFVHLFDGWNNGGSSDSNNKLVSVRGLVLDYDTRGGVLYMSKQSYAESRKRFPRLPSRLLGATLARVEPENLMQQLQQHRGEKGVGNVPCNVVWSNAHRFNPAVSGGRCVTFSAVSEGDIFVVFSAIPLDHDTWYYVQISPRGVAIYKALRLMKYVDHVSARSLGDPRLFESYFICVKEENNATVVMFGKTADNREQGHVHLVYEDSIEPIQVRFFAFGNGEHDVTIMDAHVLRTSATGEHVCVGGAIMFGGKCTENCHEECIGCSQPHLDTSCRRCRNNLHRNRCVRECPRNYVSDYTKYCVCKLVENEACVGKCSERTVPVSTGPNVAQCGCRLANEDEPNKCLTSCPQTHYRKWFPGSNQYICKRCHRACKRLKTDDPICTGPTPNECVQCYREDGQDCITCPAGKYMATWGPGLKCFSCSSGSQCPGDGRKYECSLNDNERSVESGERCDKCPRRTFSTHPPSTDCHACRAGTYKTPFSKQCEACPGETWGLNCLSRCRCAHGSCKKEGGGCICHGGFSGRFCRGPADGAIRLVNDRLVSVETVYRDGSYELQGRVEVFMAGKFYTICIQHWDNQNTILACRQMGYTNGTIVSLYNLGAGISADKSRANIKCQTWNRALMDCARSLVRTPGANCSHKRDVALKCRRYV